jgi:threonine aldolase
MASPDGGIDLRSDTVTTPTPEMRSAMANAEVGDDGYGEDPTVRRLESLAAAALGKDAAVLTPSGTMANQLALAVLGVTGTEVLCGARAHVVRYENAAAARTAGVQLRALPDDDGVFDLSSVEGVAEDQAHHLPRISLVAIENTHMPASGRPWRRDEVDAIAAIATKWGFSLYCDGARIWNAAVALETSPAELAAPAQAVMFCLSKGLGAPIGSLLCGPGDVIDAARDERKRLGGAMRQAGVIAAAGIVALETMVERLADDHERAHQLASALAERFADSVDPAVVETNIICVPAERLPEAAIERLADLGVRCGTIDARTVRFVTHKDVDDADLRRVIAALDVLAAGV